MYQEPARAIQHDPEELPKEFGDLLLADHVFLRKDNEDSLVNVGLEGEKALLNIYDVATGYKGVAASRSKSAIDSQYGLKTFVGNQADKVKSFYTDNSKELKKAAEDLGWVHPTSHPYRHASNGTMERQNGVSIAGTSTALDGSGLPHSWWPAAIRYSNFTHNIVHQDKDGVTPYR